MITYSTKALVAINTIITMDDKQEKTMITAKITTQLHNDDLLQQGAGRPVHQVAGSPTIATCHSFYKTQVTTKDSLRKTHQDTR